MKDAVTPEMKRFLNRPEVMEVIKKLSPAARARRQSHPVKCDIFNAPSCQTAADPSFRFEHDREAMRLLPDIINNTVENLRVFSENDDSFQAQYRKKRTIGIVFSGGPAPGGHNVIAGIFDAAKAANPENTVYGFLMGPDGIIDHQPLKLDKKRVDAFRNAGGFGMIYTGRTKIDTPEKMVLARETCRKMGLDALVVIGGDDSNTNAAFLAQAMIEDGIQVIGVPKTIDGDVQVKDADGNILCAISFGFHSAARAFSQEVANLCTDCSSDKKYWHICKVMGRSASHLALEVALQTHANITLIGEDLADYVDYERLAKAGRVTDFSAYGMTLRHLSRVICDGIVRRAAVGKNYGVLVIPEGVLEFINEIQGFIVKLNTIIAEFNATHDSGFHHTYPTLQDKLDYLHDLTDQLKEEGGINIWNERDDDLFNDIPAFFQEGLLIERDAHGNFQFSLVETDKVIMGMVKDHLAALRERGIYRMGLTPSWVRVYLERTKLLPDQVGPVLFENWSDENEMLLMHPDIISVKMLRNALEKADLVTSDEPLPQALLDIYTKSVPQFKTQTHFYGYDGRGSVPTEFDCRYTYNLGLTTFNLIANGATGQMAAIRHLEREFNQWEPIGIPIAPLMHLEERHGKLTLVLEKSLVELDSPAFQVVKACREKWLAATTKEDPYRVPGPIHFDQQNEESRPITLVLNALGKGILV